MLKQVGSFNACGGSLTRKQLQTQFDHSSLSLSPSDTQTMAYTHWLVKASVGFSCTMPPADPVPLIPDRRNQKRGWNAAST